MSAETSKRRNPERRDALIVFAKLPIAGTVKTRLTPTLSPEEAARLYEAFLRDALDQYLDLDVAVRLYLAPSPHAVPDYLAQLPISIHEQEGHNLGTRMLHAFKETMAEGHERAVVIGTDHPTLPSSFIRQAFAALDGPPAISIGPSEDGGYYLLGMNAVYTALFEGMEYSHARVFAETLARVRRTNAAFTVLPRWYDVDRPPDLQRLVADLDAASIPAHRTQRALAALNLDPIVASD